ncbi:MAG: valine--tRNA ligase [archaeon]
MLGKRYDHLELQKKWTDLWKKEKIFAFDRKSKKPVYSFDTPPPFTSGTLHMGHSLNHSWIDFVARYKRLTGHNVLLPQGFDCHGLPTELRVETEYKIPKENRDEFRKKCIEWTEKCITGMKRQFDEMGYSADWDYEYRTMDADYKARVQSSLLEFFRKGMIYRKEHPTHWCTKCGTAIANAELGYSEMDGTLHYIEFKTDAGKPIQIATTRPELSPACVAVLVHPDDERYKAFHNKKATLPVFNRQVPILADSDVDREFGTGAVYVCTYGDEMDFKWQAKYKLPVISAIGRDGKMTEAAGKYAGLTAKGAREQFLKDLEKEGALKKTEKFRHNVLVHAERGACRQPVEMIPTFQWFIKLRDKSEMIAEGGKQMKWFPEYMLRRLTDWAYGLDWDWVISRQRVFGTPIPFWYCQCGEIIPAREDDLPVDPTTQKPPIKKCPKCGSDKMDAPPEVCDCWVDSSISPLVASGWKKKDDVFKMAYPVSNRPQGYEIIRTWLFYTTFRCLELTGKVPFKEVMVNGMVHGEDGRKMSKSFNNYVAPDEAIRKYGADSLRMWASYSVPGSDLPFSWKDVEYSHKFLTKFWNAARFAMMHLEDYKGGNAPKLEAEDRWILSKLSALAASVTDAFEKFEFINAVQPVQQFIWKDFCDNYLEMVKHRLYEPEKYGKATREAAQYTLYTVLKTTATLLSPVAPFFCEEIYSCLPGKKETSISFAKWPEAEEADKGAEGLVSQAIEAIAYLRKYKTERNMSMNAALGKVVISSEEDLRGMESTIKATMKIGEIEYSDKKGGDKVSERIFIKVED